MTNLVDKIQAQKIGDILHMLVENYEKNPDSYFVKASLFLNNGLNVTGIVTKIEEVDGYKHLMLADNPMDEKQMNLTFLPLSQVIGVHLYNAQYIAPQLSNGKIARIPGAASEISGLDCKRKLQLVWDEIKEEGSLQTEFNISWDTCADTNEVRLNVLDTAKAVKKSVLAIIQDDLGKEAFSQVTKFTVSHSPENKVMIDRNDSEILLKLNLELMLPSRLHEKIGDSLNSLLG